MPAVLVALALRGPRMTLRVGEGLARRVAGMDAGQFVTSTGCAADQPRSPPANPQDEVRRARHPRCLFFWLLSLGKQRKV